ASRWCRWSSGSATSGPGATPCAASRRRWARCWGAGRRPAAPARNERPHQVVGYHAPAVPEPRTRPDMSVSVRIPTTLRTLTGGSSEVSLEGSDVREVLDNLDRAHPGFAQRLLDDEGNLRRF